jgi:hypothetical protein
MLFFVEVSFFKFVLKQVVTNNYVNYFYLFFLFTYYITLFTVNIFYITTEIWAQKFMIGLQYKTLVCLFLPLLSHTF